MRTITGEYGDLLYTAILPEYLLFITTNRMYVKFRLTDSTNQPIVGERIQLVVQMLNQMYTNEFRYTDKDGWVTYNIARLLRIGSNNEDKELDNINYRPDTFSSWLTANVFIDIYMGAERIMRERFQYFNGKHDITRDWWHKTRRIKWWKKYPMTFDFTNQKKVNIKGDDGFWRQVVVPYIESSLTQLIRFNPAYLARYADNRLTIEANAQAQFSSDFNDDYSKTHSQGIAIEQGQVKENINRVVISIDNCDQDLDKRCYLRWLGEHGEVFYWLFFIKTESESTRSTIYIRAMTDDQYQGNETNRYIDNGVVKDSETTRTRSIYSELLSDDYYEYVRQVVSSSYVDMYLGDNRWQRVTVQDGSVSKDMNMSGSMKRHRVSLIIQL